MLFWSLSFHATLTRVTGSGLYQPSCFHSKKPDDQLAIDVNNIDYEMIVIANFLTTSSQLTNANKNCFHIILGIIPSIWLTYENFLVKIRTIYNVVFSEA